MGARVQGWEQAFLGAWGLGGQVLLGGGGGGKWFFLGGVALRVCRLG